MAGERSTQNKQQNPKPRTFHFSTETWSGLGGRQHAFARRDRFPEFVTATMMLLSKTAAVISHPIFLSHFAARSLQAATIFSTGSGPTARPYGSARS